MVALRRGGQGDLELLTALERQCFPRDPWGEAALGTALSEPGYIALVAEAPTESGLAIVGYVIGWHVLDEADLARLGVVPELRQRGLGRRLVQGALEYWCSVGVNKVFLDVRAGNGAALGLYASLGFERVGYRKSYYGDGEDAVLMAYPRT